MTLENGRIAGPGVVEAGLAHNVYQHLVFDGARFNSASSGAPTLLYDTFVHGAYVSTDQLNALDIEHDTFVDGPLTATAMDLGATYTTARYDTVYGYGTGLRVEGLGSGIEATGNAFYRSGTGIRIGGEPSTIQGALRDNLVVGSHQDGMVIGSGTGISVPYTGPTAFAVTHNVLVSNGGDGIRISSVPDVPLLPTGLSVTLGQNVALANGNYGIESPGDIPDPDPARAITVTDAGGNVARANANPAQCLNISCNGSL